MAAMSDPIVLALRAVTLSLEALRLEIRAHAAATAAYRSVRGPFASPPEQAAVRLQEQADRLARQVMEEAQRGGDA